MPYAVFEGRVARFDCGCTAGRGEGIEPAILRLDYCPLHAKAPEMLEWLKKAEQMARQQHDETIDAPLDSAWPWLEQNIRALVREIQERCWVCGADLKLIATSGRYVKGGEPVASPYLRDGKPVCSQACASGDLCEGSN